MDKREKKPKINISKEAIEKIYNILVKEEQYHLIDILLHSISGFHLKKFSSESLEDLVNTINSSQNKLENYSPFRLLVTNLIKDRKK